jgi:hypothetical protein
MFGVCWGYVEGELRVCLGYVGNRLTLTKITKNLHFRVTWVITKINMVIPVITQVAIKRHFYGLFVYFV